MPPFTPYFQLFPGGMPAVNAAVGDRQGQAKQEALV